MARPLHGLLITNTATLFIFVAAVFVTAASIVSFLCTSHKNAKVNKGRRMPDPPLTDDHRNLLLNTRSITGKASAMAKMILWKRSDLNEEEALWKKTVLMGERCRPLEFSGKIAYDAEGNPVPELPLSLPENENGYGNASKGKR